ncbi:hypothetical protein ACI77M_02590 [Pseudomonas fildesensis]|uniref:hypothetical protein n=1 Tax=Pseudomonas fildesensis TaxID=1674920 RepID=UPI00387B6F4F
MTMTITASAAHLPLPQHNQSAIRPDSNTPLTANTPPDSRALGDNQLTQNMISAMNKRKDYQQEPVQIPPSSTLGQWRTQLAFALKNPEFQDWIKDTRIAPGSIVIFPDTDSISVAINHRRVTFTPNDSSGWSSVAAPVLAAGEVIAGGSGDPIHYNDAFRDTVEVRKVASFYGSPVMERMIHKETASTHTNAEPGQIFQPRHHPEYGDYTLHKQRQAVADIYHRHTEQIPPTEDNSNDKKVDPRQKPAPVASPDSEFYSARATIYGSDTISPPTTGYTVEERLQHIDAFAKRVKNQIGDIESGNEGARNVKFQNARLLTEPAGYFSAGLLAAGYDPHEKITVTFTSYTGMGKPDVLTHTDKRTYFAWEIAAGALAHDKVQRGGPINFNFMHIESQDRSKVKDLESLGEKLQNHWEDEIAKPMRVASGAVAQRSGKADAYVIRATLQNLRDNKDSIEKLSPAGQEAVNRTLDNNGQVIIPNLYGYPLAGYAFIPYTPYDGNDDHRPNKGVMIDLKNGKVHEIQGDKGFADWAKNNRNNLQRSFNASDRQGGEDAHWPKAVDVLDNFIAGNHATYPGYSSFLKDKAVPVWETFNYTQSRGDDYQLKYGNLNSSIASKYQEVNAKNAVWSDQTEVFGSSQQNWKAAKDFWGNTFGYVPVVGNAGNIVFGVHDSIYGMKADDRVGGNAAAVLSSLQLVHEAALLAVDPSLGKADVVIESAATEHFSWKLNGQTQDFELVRVPKVSTEINPANELTPSALPDNHVIRTPELTNERIAELDNMLTRPSASSVDELFFENKGFSTLLGKITELKEIDEELYTFVDSSKLGKDTRLNILVHGSTDPSTGITYVKYDGELNTPQELLDTLHLQGVKPEKYEKIRLISCSSGDDGTESFAAEFQRLINRPVKGYEGTVTVSITPETIKLVTDKLETHYRNRALYNKIPLTPILENDIRLLAERDAADGVMRTFKTFKKNPHWNPWKWWEFTYKPVRFS